MKVKSCSKDNRSTLEIKIQYYNMPLFRITVMKRVYTNCVRLEQGMRADVITHSFSNPVYTNGGKNVVEAFRRIYGVDIKKAGALNDAYLKVKRIG